MKDAKPDHIKIILYSYLYILVTSLIILIISIFLKDIVYNVLGYAIGALGSLIGYNLIIRFVNHLNMQSKVQAKAVSNFMFRMVIYGFLIYASWTQGLNYYLTFFGLFSVKIVILLNQLLNKEKK